MNPSTTQIFKPLTAAERAAARAEHERLAAEKAQRQPGRRRTSPVKTR